MKPKVFIPIRHDETFLCLDGIRNGDNTPIWRAFLRGLSGFDVFVDTDSLTIKQEIDNDPLSPCTAYMRSRSFLGDATTTNDLIEHFIDRYWIQHEAVIQTHITHPFLSQPTLQRAWECLGISARHDSVMSVDTQAKRLWSRDSVGHFPLNHNPMNLRRTSQLPPIFCENSAFYVFTAERFRAFKNRLGLNPYFFEIAAPETTAITGPQSWLDLKSTAAHLATWLPSEIPQATVPAHNS